jgi:hypothetical protein
VAEKLRRVSMIIHTEGIEQGCFNSGESTCFSSQHIAGIHGRAPDSVDQWPHCNIPRFYQILGEFFCFCFVCIDWKFAAILKLLSLVISFTSKTFPNSLIILEEFLWENERFQKYYFLSLIQTYTSLLAEKWISNVSINLVF